MKKKIAMLLATSILMTGAFTACSDKKNNDSDETSIEETEIDELVEETIEIIIPEDEEVNSVATALRLQFRSEMLIDNDIEAMANSLINNEVLDGVTMTTMPVSEGYLNGFDGDVTGFNDGIMFAPMIGTIPFVGYIFESDDPEALADALNNQAMLDWNICTFADEAIIAVEGDYVFFVMAPYAFE
ncbi:MAG: hypothetical protein MJ094_07115 [Saccharofermentans sp.]|nr:hypothetical protein [Saccharofermentans sp.]